MSFASARLAEDQDIFTVINEVSLDQPRDLAAQALCNQPEILKEYKGKGISREDAEAACEAAHNFGPREPEPEPTGHLLELEEGHDEDIMLVQMQQQELVTRLEALEQRPEPRPRVVMAPAPRAPEPAFTEEQKQAAWEALFQGREDDRDVE